MIKILLIDHAAPMATSVRNLLAESCPNNFKVNAVLSYRGILKGFRSHDADVCVIDSAFGNGLKLFTQARGMGCTAPVILLTENSAAEVLEAIHSGVADCLIRDGLDVARVERAICSVVEQARGARLQLERARRYLALLDTVDTIIYTHDLEGNLTSINRAGELLLGFSQQELLGIPVSRLMAPGYRTRMVKMIEAMMDARSKVVEAVEFVTRDGWDLAVTITIHPIYREGKAVEIQGLATPLRALPAAPVLAAGKRSGPKPTRTLAPALRVLSFTQPRSLDDPKARLHLES